MNAPNGLTLPVARARVPSNMSKAPPTKTTMPPMTQSCATRSRAPAIEMPKPMRVRPLGVRPARPIARATGSKTFLIRPRDSLEMVTSSTCHAQDGAFAGRELLERLLAQAADRLAALPAGHHDTGRPETTQMPRHERLAEADVGDELRHGRLALGTAAAHHGPRSPRTTPV